MSGVSGLQDEYFMCKPCAIERGYLWPEHLDSLKFKAGCCDACFRMGLVYDINRLDHMAIEPQDQ